MKKIFTILLLMVSLHAAATIYSGSCGDNVTYTLDTESGLLKIEGSGAMADYSSNSTVPWYSNRTKITQAEIADGVTSIGNYAFYDCYYITSVTIPNSVTSVGDGAFYNCSGLTSVTIPNSVTSIGIYAFSYCSGLASITIPDSVTIMSSNVFQYCRGLTSVTIPKSVTGIGYNAFEGCSGLTSITIPDSVRIIGSCAFYDCTGLRFITIPESVTGIGSDAFQNCKNLKRVYNNSSLNITTGSTSNGYVAYYADKVINNAKFTGDYIYMINDDNQIVLCDYLKNDSTIELPPDIDGAGYIIGDRLFYNRKDINSVIVPGNVISIGQYAFYGCTGLSLITIPNSVTSIGNYAFSDCTGLKSVTIPNSVTSIGNYAFYNCASLSSITIPNSVTSIGSSAFQNCKNLKRVYNNSSLNITTGSTNNGYVAYYADKVINNAKFTDNFAYIINDSNQIELCSYIGEDSIINLPELIEGNKYTIANKAFYNYSGILSVKIPNSVTSIGSSSFANCYGLKSIELPNSITSIESSTFSKCICLTSISIPNSVTIIGDDAFLGCTSLSSIIIPNSVRTIGLAAFSGCSALSTLKIPNSVTSIDNQAFEFCTGLTSVNLSSSIDKISTLLFYGCTGLSSITIPSSVVTIGTNAFSGCTSLTDVIIPNSVIEINRSAFKNCTGLTSITIGNSVTSIGEKAFYNCSNLNTINCYAVVPPTCSSNETFLCDTGVRDKYDIYTYANLHVPEGYKDIYSSANEWRYFSKIYEDLPITTEAYSQLTIKLGTTGYSKHNVKTNETYSLVIGALSGYKVNAVAYNGEDVTDQVVDGYFTTPTIKGASVLTVTYELDQDDAIQAPSQNENVKVIATDGGVEIGNITEPTAVTVYNIDGKMIKTRRVSSIDSKIDLPEDNIYIIKLGDRTFKVAI